MFAKFANVPGQDTKYAFQGLCWCPVLRMVRIMLMHAVRAWRSADDFPCTEHMAYKIAQVAADPVDVDPEVADMVCNRIIDNAAVSAASMVRRPVTVARHQALAHPVRHGAKVFGVEGSYSADWAAWANGVAARELDFHDTFLAADYSHPADNIPHWWRSPSSSACAARS